MIRPSTLCTLFLLLSAWTSLFGGEARIARVWHGKTPASKAAAYTDYLGEAIQKFSRIPGNQGYQMFRETIGDVTHFTVISYWRSRKDIEAYAGADIRKTRHLPRDAEFLINPEKEVMNYDIVVDKRE